MYLLWNCKMMYKKVRSGIYLDRYLDRSVSTKDGS